MLFDTAGLLHVGKEFSSKYVGSWFCSPDENYTLKPVSPPHFRENTQLIEDVYAVQAVCDTNCLAIVA